MIHLHSKKDKDAEQYHIKVPEYRAPDISYQKKPPDVLRSSNLKVRKCQKHTRYTGT